MAPDEQMRADFTAHAVKNWIPEGCELVWDGDGPDVCTDSGRRFTTLIDFWLGWQAAAEHYGKDAERVEALRVASHETIASIRSLAGYGLGNMHPNDFCVIALEIAAGNLASPKEPK